MASPETQIVRDQLTARREMLAAAVLGEGPDPEVRRLLTQVDAALARIDGGTYGLCRACHESIETDRLIADPLTEFCLDHLSAPQQRALEDDLMLAARIQRALLPDRNVQHAGWSGSYHYEGAGPVSGDYCDFVVSGESDLWFFIGDVAGKGISAAMLMSHLHAMFRALVAGGFPIAEMMERASRALCESTLPTSYATLVCGRAKADGEIEVCNAGHPQPLHLRGREVSKIEASGLPIGMFCDQKYAATRLRLEPRDTLLMYTDGITETRDPSGDEYGLDRLGALMSGSADLEPGDLVAACAADVTSFRDGAPSQDDLTLMALRRSG